MINLFILDKPYVSKFLEETIKKLKLPVLKNKATAEFKLENDINYIGEKDFIEKIKKEEYPLLYR